MEESEFAAVLRNSIGPFISFLGISLHDSVDLFLISKAYGPTGTQTVGMCSLIRYFIVATGLYFGQCSLIKISYLLGRNKQREASEFLFQIYVITVLGMICAGFIFYFLSTPILKLMNCSPSIIHDGREYLLYIAIFSPFIGLYQLSIFVLQSQGRSVLVGAIQLIAFATNCCVIGPALLFGLKVTMKYSGMSYGISFSIAGIVLTVLVFRSKFSITPTVSLEISKYIPSALISGSSFFINVIANSLAPALLIRFGVSMSRKIDAIGEITALFSVVIKLQSLVNSLSTAVTQGMMTSCSYEYGKGNIERFKRIGLLGYAGSWILLGVSSIVVILFPGKVSSLWLRTDGEFHFAEAMLPIMYFTEPLNSINDATTALLLASRKSIPPNISPVLRSLTLIVSGFIIKSESPGNPIPIMYSYVASDLAVLVLNAIILVIY